MVGLHHRSRKREKPNLVIDGQSLVGHTGSTPDYSDVVMHQVEKDYTIAILRSLSTIEQGRLLAEIQKIMFTDEVNSRVAL